MQLWRWVRAYAGSDDPLVAAGNLIALLVASNQPFYPLYIYWFVTTDVRSSLLTFLSTPFFLAVPAVARRHALAGRAMLPIVGVLNTILCAKLFGEASGVELFLAPCLMVAAMLFRRNERLVMLGLVGFCFVVFVGLRGRYGTPVHLFTADEYGRFFNLNALSVGSLMAFVGLTFSNVLSQVEAASPIATKSDLG